MKNVLLIVPLLLLGCPKPANCPEPEDPAKYEPTCKDACDNLAKLGCPEAEPTKKGQTCVEVCKDTEAAGANVTLNPGCVANMKSCDEIDSCTGSR